MAIEQLRRVPFLNQLWQRLEAMPPPKTEESILLRVLVQGLVIVGIIATDIVAQMQMSFWAVPLSIVGATWSWYRRRERNVTVKFLIAIGMLVAMFAFFGNLFANLNDTRLVLAELLVQLQVLHSFDLPRRKDLGYSMVIGLILLGVAGTVSQTLAFAPFLLIFLAIALPTLVLDYRSRLGLESIDAVFRRRQSRRLPRSDRPSALNYSPLSPQRLSLFLLIILILGLTIFALMPRFPGYQLQTFPVSSPIDVENQGFDLQNSGIVNPGYVGEGSEGSSSDVGEGLAEGPGKIDDTFYYGFNSKMNQNLRGQMKRKVVMRVRSQAPGFWRVMAFDRYKGQGWEISRNEKLINIKRPNWSYRFFISQPQPTNRTKKVIQSYTAVSNLPNLIPALSYPKYLYFPTKEVAIDPEGSLRAPLGLLEGLTYTVISEVPYRDRTLLGEAPENYSEGIKTQYLQIPPEIAEEVRQKAEELLAKSPKPITSAYEKALFLAQAIKQNYGIQPDLPFFDKDEDLVEAFLFHYEGGYPDHFSTVLTVMLRSIGIPARLAVGFAPGQFNPFTGYYIVHNTDAYALTEVYIPRYGWFSFDPIPGHELIPPSFEESQTFGVLRQFWNWVAGWLPSPVTSFISNLWSEIIGVFFRIIAWLWRFFSGSLVGLFTGLMTAIALGFLGWLGWNQMQSWGYRRRLAKLAPIERVYQQMLGVLKAKGYPKHPAQTPLEYAQISRQHYQVAAAEIIEEISQAYVCWRYGEKMPNINYLQQQLKALIRSMRRLS
ncbi:MAG: DUF3488 and DUF4129 domain-containing transglutaminase family protein [Xenococcaceae cyanobacterium]